MLLSTLLSAKAAAALGAGVVVLSGGATAAAYAGALPATLQTVAHNTVGAPAADQADDATPEPSETSESPKALEPTGVATTDSTESPDASPSGSPVGPDATGPAAFGLCNAYSHGGVPQNSTAYQSLVKAAGTGTIDAYCATVPHPGKPSPAPSVSSTDSASPSATSSTATTKHATKGKKHHGKPSTAPGRPATTG